MVKKLFKHEILSYLRLLLPLYGVLLGIAVLGRLVQFFESDSVVYIIVNLSSILMFSLAVFACLALTTIFCVIRFYKNLFTGEGYLSFTLPVTATHHLLVKTITAVLVTLWSLVAILLAGCIFTAGDVLVEVVKAIDYLVRYVYRSFGSKSYHLTLYILEIALFLLLAFFYEYLLYYSCISLGQIARKNRVLAAVGVYFGYYMLTQMISTVITVIITLWQTYAPWVWLDRFIDQHPHSFLHPIFGIFILVYAAMIVGFFFLNRWVIRRKLNLE